MMKADTPLDIGFGYATVTALHVMSDAPPTTGSISWTDLTVPDADQTRRFYAAVAGWTSTPLDMGAIATFA